MPPLASLLFLAAMANATPATDVDVCMRAAAAAARSSIADSDHEGCVCTVQQLRKTLTPGDYELHETMEEIIASGADEKSFNSRLSAVMLKRGMNQADANAFLARARAAEARAQQFCNPAPPP
ncbi:MAG: hypothetical protein ACREHE_12930 [Rhizomicrobium sp.]